MLNAVLAEAGMSLPATAVLGRGWAPKLLRGDERRWPKSNAAGTPTTTAIMWQVKIFVPAVANMLSAFAAGEVRFKAPPEALGPSYIELLIRYDISFSKNWSLEPTLARGSDERGKLAYLCRRLDSYVRTNKRTGAAWQKAPCSGRKRSWQVV